VIGAYQWSASYGGDNNNGTAHDQGGTAEQTVVSPATPAINTTPGGSVALGGITISGTKFLDLTGNGFSADDTPLGGVTINLYVASNNSGGLQVGGGGDTFVASTTTANDGTYKFNVSTPGTYFVQEVVPSGYIQTGGGPNGSAGNTYYTIVASAGTGYSGINFDDFQIPTCMPTNVCYTVTTPSHCTTTVNDLGGNTQQGDTVTVTFTVPAGMSDTLTLVSYVAPGNSFSDATAYQQAIYQSATGTFAPGTHSLTVKIPNSDYQIDFVCGQAINQLEPNGYGPDSVNILYHAENRFISSDNSGTTTPTTSSLNSSSATVPSPTSTPNATAPLSDSATLSGGNNPTGTVTFYLFAPGVMPNTNNSNNVYTDSVSITGNATYTTSMGNHPGGYVPTAAGTYQWVAVYSGDTKNSPMTSPYGSEPETVTGSPITISGYKFNDLNGDGIWETTTSDLNGDDVCGSSPGSPAEPGLGGVTIQLFTDTNGTLSPAIVNGTQLSTVTSSSAGNLGFYTFTNLPTLAPGVSYAVREVVPSGWIETTNNPPDVSGTGSTSATNENFGDYMLCNCSTNLTHVTYLDTAYCGTTKSLSSLAGNTNQGDTITVNFTNSGSMATTYTLVSYVAPNGNFNTANLQGQTIFQYDTETVAPGAKGSLTVTLPNCYFQLDFVCGLAIPQLAGNSNDLYHAQNRYIDGDTDGSQVCAPSTLCGTIFCDANNNGSYTSGEAGIAGDIVTLTGVDFQGNSVSLTTTTNSKGLYTFTNVAASNAAGYTITATLPSGYLPGTISCGTNGGTACSSTQTISNICVNTNNACNNNNFGELSPSCLTGMAYVDYWRDGSVDNGDIGICNVTLTLTGTDDQGHSVSCTTTTDANGLYSFNNLRPGNYQVCESQPAGSGYVQGSCSPGQVNGASSGTSVSVCNIGNISLTPGALAVHYNFGTWTTASNPITKGESAAISFWHNSKGQQLINSFNGGANATALGNWLATSFPNLYGPGGGSLDLTNKPNSYVANLMLTYFQNSQLNANVLDAALNVYATTSSLGGSIGTSYGFAVSSTGFGADTYNIGSNGTAFGVANNTVLTVWQILDATNDASSSTSGTLYNGNTINQNKALTVYVAINTAGGIS
jgi:SdrD B-like domain/Prealbumin-like fold domain